MTNSVAGAAANFEQSNLPADFSLSELVLVELNSQWGERLALAEQTCFGAAGWSRTQIDSAFASPSVKYLGWVFSPLHPEQPELVGYAAVRLLSGEGELLTIALLPAYRQRGWSKPFLQAIEAFLHDRRVRTVFLEVRESNQPARALYQGSGYCLLGKRKKYYRHPTEDALVLEHRLSAPSPGPVGAEAITP